jgi:hypothetical protein
MCETHHCGRLNQEGGMTKKGSGKAGPSNAYLRMLSGKITSKQYTEQVKRSTSRTLRSAQRRG